MFQKMTGQTLDHYKIASLLGVGGMGAVFKGVDMTLQREVAIKVMHPHLAAQRDFQDRFLQEARTLARMDHPGIVQIIEFNNKQSLLYIVMKFIPGANLEQMLVDLKAHSRWFPMGEAVQLVRHVALSLDYAHHLGVLHRDIKASNIMIEPVPSDHLPYRPVITDLGLAKLGEGGVSTQTGTAMGTPAYMSPEQAEGKPLDPRSDVYSMGVLLFYLITGQLPFPAKTLSEAVFYHTTQPPPLPRSFCPNLPEQLEKVILRAMEKSTANRIPTAALLAKALESLPAQAMEIAVTAAPGSPVSLITEYKESLVAPRGPSILEEFVTPPNLNRDTIQVLTGGKTTQSVTMKPEGLTIGRDSDNDIVLLDPNVSRKHARIEFEKGNYRIIDQNSTNGTYLANNKLLPGIAETWLPGQALRVGDNWLRILHMSPAVGTMPVLSAAASGRTHFDPGQIRSSSGEGRVGLYIASTALSVEPGQSVRLSVVLINQGALVDQFNVAVSGVPKQWISCPDGTNASVRLMPGDQQEVALIIQPPRVPQSRAGQYPLTVRVSSQGDPGQAAESNLILTIAPFTQFTSELQPQKIRVGRKGRIMVRNLGNVQDTVAIKWQDTADEISFKPNQTQLSVREGQDRAVDFEGVPRQARWIGGEKSHIFTAQVATARGGSQTLTGEIISRAWIPMWIVPLVFLLCFALAGSSAFLYPMLFPAPTPTLTFVPTWTPSPSPVPGAPKFDQWCIYPVGQPASQLIGCPNQVVVQKGQKVTIVWQSSEADSVTLAPFGDRPNQGQEDYLPLTTTSITLTAYRNGKPRTETIQVIVEMPTETPTAFFTPTVDIKATELVIAQKATADYLTEAAKQLAAGQTEEARRATAQEDERRRAVEAQAAEEARRMTAEVQTQVAATLTRAAAQTLTAVAGTRHLWYLDRQGNPKPDLAKSWDINPDSTRLVVTLPKGCQLKTGEPLTTMDIQRALSDWIRQHRGYKFTVVDDYTFMIDGFMPLPFPDTYGELNQYVSFEVFNCME